MATYYPPSGHIDALVFDIGGVVTRAGFAGEDAPRVFCPSAVGTYASEQGGVLSVAEMDTLGWARPDLQV